MSLMTPESLRRMADLTSEQWQAAALKWARMGRVVLIDQARQSLCRAACAWAGVPLAEQEVEQRARALAALIDAPAALGGQILARPAGAASGRAMDRRRCRTDARRTLHVAQAVRADVIARYRELDGKPLDARVAAVELLNLLRPIVAIAIYIAFTARALHEQPVRNRT